MDNHDVHDIIAGLFSFYKMGYQILELHQATLLHIKQLITTYSA
jgi:hypothetical protein